MILVRQSNIYSQYLHLCKSLYFTALRLLLFLRRAYSQRSDPLQHLCLFKKTLTSFTADYLRSRRVSRYPCKRPTKIRPHPKLLQQLLQLQLISDVLVFDILKLSQQMCASILLYTQDCQVLNSGECVGQVLLHPARPFRLFMYLYTETSNLQ